jgi:glyoxylate carboligase
MTKNATKLPSKALLALRSARRLLIAERKSQFDCFTIPPRRSYRQMNRDERAVIVAFDKVIEKINGALQ